ncbi:TatD family hydrolase [Patescibacteria group bacterium]
MLIDTHAHLDFSKFKNDRDEVIKRARDFGVAKIINAASYHQDFGKVRAIAEGYPNIWQLAGSHPHDTELLTYKNWVEDTKEYAQNEQVVGIGEIGLDYNDMRNTKEEQLQLFRSQVDIAMELRLPVVLHVRDAFNEVYEIVKDKKLSGVVHCFSGDWQEAQRWLDLGYLISFTGIITYPKTDSLAEVVKNMPLDRIMLETDAPFLAPQSVRGERCEPAHVKDIAERVAEIRGISVDEVAKQTTLNAEKFFGI